MNWLDDFARYHEGLSQEEFCQRYPHPFLIVQVLLGADDEEQRVTPATASLSPEELGVADAPLEILPVKSRKGRDHVALGRSRDNDLILRSGLISAHHARFTVDDGDRWAVTDLGSKNGTAVHFKVLPEGEAHAVKDRTQVIFGGAFHTTFMSSSGLYHFLQEHYWSAP